MRKRHLILSTACIAAAATFCESPTLATVNIDGQRDGDYGAAIKVQTNNSGFGNSTAGDGLSLGGSELDAAYGIVQGSNLNLFFSGNIETGGTNNSSYNHLNVFIAGVGGVQNTLNVSGALSNSNGSKFSSDFTASYALDINGNSSTEFVNYYDLTKANGPSTFLGSLPLNDGAAHTLTTTTTSATFSINNTNAAGVTDDNSVAADHDAAAAVSTGFEISIPLSALGSPTGPIKVLAAVNGGNDGFYSNQFLSGLPYPTGNVGGHFDFSSGTGMYFTIAVPASGATNGVWNLPGSGSWNSSSSWTGGIPHLPADSANFGTLITGAATVNLDGSKTVGKVIFNNTNSYTIARGSGGTLTIDDTGNTLGVNPAIAVQLGSHTLLAPVVLANGVSIVTQDATSLAIRGGLSGAGAILHDGGGKLILGGTNTFTGSVVSLDGTLQLESAAAASASAINLGDPDVDNLPATLTLGTAGLNVTNPLVTNRDLAANNNLRLVNSIVAGNTTVSGTVSLNGGVVFGTVAGGTLTVSGLIQNGADTSDSARRAIRVNGAGTVVLTNSETSTGDTFVDSGTLVLAATASLQGGSLNVFTGGTVYVNGALASGVKIFTGGNINFPGVVSGAGTTVSVGTITVDAGGRVKLASSTSSTNNLTIDAGTIEFIGDSTGKIDLANNRLLTSNDQITVRNQLQFANIFTSATTGTLGYRDNGAGKTEILRLLAGDSNFSGGVDVNDFTALSGNFNQTGKFWTDGDFNYDGVINALDFNAIAANFGKPLPASGSALGTLVPEPCSMALFAVACLSLSRRTRKTIAR